MKRLLKFFGFYHINDISKAACESRTMMQKDMREISKEMTLAFFKLNNSLFESERTKMVSYNFVPDLMDFLEKPKTQKYNLYLDDERTPKTNKDWVVVRSFKEFKKVIRERGLPAEMSLDHDLGKFLFWTRPTGYDCVKWLVDEQYDLREVKINVHSANPVGKDNMEGLVRSWNKFLDRELKFKKGLIYKVDWDGVSIVTITNIKGNNREVYAIERVDANNMPTGKTEDYLEVTADELNDMLLS